MPSLARPFGPILLLVAALGLAACDSAEDRAEAHYRRGLDLAAAGEIDRAMIEFRNVFRLNDAHAAARLEFARLLRDRGDVAGALAQYQRLVDQDRDTLEGHLELAELALAAQDFETATLGVKRAYELAPADPTVRALKATLDYRAGERDAALAMAIGVIAETPGAVAAHMVTIADRMNEGDAAGALVRIDAGLAAAPGDEGLHLVRLAALERLGDTAETGAQIARMAELFPENPGVSRALVQWRLREGDTAGAETALRDLAARDPEAAEPALTVVQFLYETQGAAAAAAELDRLIAASPAPLPFRRARAGLDFAEGRADAAIAALRALTDGAEPSDTIRDLQTELASMLETTGDTAGRDALLATVLEGDPRHIGALKLRARARVAADQPDLAIQDMRTALAEAPRDPEIMTIMAMAHEREGSRELAGERLSLAVEVSDRAPAESLRYARFLMQDDRLGPAEGVILDALRRAPNDRDLLAMIGRIHVQRRDWPRADQAADLLRATGDPVAAEMAAGIEMASLAAQDRTEETFETLRDLAGTGENAAALAQLMQGYLATGDLAAAQAYLDDALAADPTNLAARMMQAGLHAARGEAQAAEALYRALIAETPAAPQPHRGLVALLASQGQAEAAETALAAGLAATNDDADLLFLQASLLESRGDVEAAIGVYETLYARDTANPLLANNLASLLTTRRSDPESLERAFAIARRLRMSDVPHFQDTYGWILHRRGDSEQALGFLEPAAAALGDTALVQYHLGEAQFALGRRAEARASFRQAIDLAEDGAEATLPQISAARARLVEIDAAPAPAEAVPSDG